MTVRGNRMKPIRTLIMGAAGRDFHNFNVLFRDDPGVEVLAFTATQIPNIEGRIYPPELAGELYPQGIPIEKEDHLAAMIRRDSVEEVVFAYSDISHQEVMHKASQVIAAGAHFKLLGGQATMIGATLPVVAVGAVRTGCGKSQTTRRVGEILKRAGKRIAVVRHPMPYGDLKAQQVQRFSSLEDLKSQGCTIEEMEEYEPHIIQGTTVYAGVDYQAILGEVEREADIILWDGGNNDLPFYRPDLHIVVVDPHRPGHEINYHPGETNLLLADAVVINKINTAPAGNVERVRVNIQRANPGAQVIEAASPITVEDPALIRGRRVLVVEDGPTVTHGGMGYGAGTLAAQQYGAGEVVDPRPHTVGSISAIFENYPQIGPLLPAMGYGRQQMQDLEATIAGIDCDTVVIGTPVDLRRIISIPQPAVRVSYHLEELGRPNLEDALADLL